MLFVLFFYCTVLESPQGDVKKSDEVCIYESKFFELLKIGSCIVNMFNIMCLYIANWV